MEMKKLMSTIVKWLEQGKDVALSTIIADSGSTPRGAGARMAMTESGEFAGTIGGGGVEYRAGQLSLTVLKCKESLIEHFTLSKNDKNDLGMVCGGEVTVYIQYISSGDSKTLEMFKCAGKLFEQNADSWIVTDITKKSEWRMGVYAPELISGSLMTDNMQEKGFFSSRGVQIEVSDRKYYSEPLTKSGKVFVFGGGHISKELVPLLTHLGFSCVVFDSIAKFASAEAFPDAHSLVVGDFENISAKIEITEKDYAVIMTRGHSFDYTVQAQVLKYSPRYIGVIGSRAKIKVVTELLLKDGFSQEVIDTVHMPVGVDIKADTPAEIAVSIAAELIMVRAQASEQF